MTELFTTHFYNVVIGFIIYNLIISISTDLLTNYTNNKDDIYKLKRNIKPEREEAS